MQKRKGFMKYESRRGGFLPSGKKRRDTVCEPTRYRTVHQETWMCKQVRDVCMLNPLGQYSGNSVAGSDTRV